jgi:chemotaxis protein MotC
VRSLRSSHLAVAMLLVSISSAFAQSTVAPPFEAVRSMQILHDRIAQGDASAYRAQPMLISQIGLQLLASDNEAWQEARNTRAALTFALGGGQSTILKRLVELGDKANIDKNLLNGVLAYVEGREPIARDLLKDVDARSLPAILGGHVALIQSGLVAHDDPAKALALLDLARLLAPGTLIEEAALRREIIATEIGDQQRFMALARQYMRRFQHSIYAETFKQQLTARAIQIGISSTSDQFGKLEDLLNEWELDERRQIYLSMARTAVSQAMIAAGRRAADRASHLAVEGSLDAAQAKLYEAASLIFTDDYELGRASLESLNRSRLPKSDVDLYDRVVSVAKLLRKWPDPSQVEAFDIGADSDRDHAHVSTALDTIRLAEQAISEADQLMQKGAP